MYGDKKENSVCDCKSDHFQRTDRSMSSLLFPKPVYHKPNVKGRFLRKKSGMQLSSLFIFLVLLFIFQSGSQLRLSVMVRSRYNEAGENTDCTEQYSGRQFAREVHSCLNNVWAEFSWKLMGISNPNFWTVFLKDISICASADSS